MDDKRVNIKDIDVNDLKPVIKEAIKEWMDDNLADFGWFALKAIVIVAFGALAWAYAATGGFKIK